MKVFNRLLITLGIMVFLNIIILVHSLVSDKTFERAAIDLIIIFTSMLLARYVIKREKDSDA